MTQAPGRRTFLGVTAWLMAGLAAVVVAIPFVGYLFGSLRRRWQNQWIDLGPLSAFPIHQTRVVDFVNPLRQPWDGMAANTSVFVRYRGEGADRKHEFMVLAVNCTHLGCPVTWFPQSGLFMCPCHGGVYYEDGERASGPPPRGLYHCVWRVRADRLEIQAPHLPTLQDTLTPEDRR
jgi:Rieske Fe-S protein